jgi:hypothetical protein
VSDGGAWSSVKPEAAAGLRDVLSRTRPSPAEICRRAGVVRAEVSARSPNLTTGSFIRIEAADLRLLFELYDRGFVDGSLARALAGGGDGGLRFRLSRRMTSAAGRLVCHRDGRRGGRTAYEIVISTHLLFENFREGQREVQANGLVCGDRMDALQRIFEHELVHLAEVLAYGATSCGGKRFRGLARRLFGHAEVTHRLVTTREAARSDWGLTAGDRVTFRFRGSCREGLINRITKRATVLVADPRGARYSDGNRYLKFYVPLHHLQRR